MSVELNKTIMTFSWWHVQEKDNKNKKNRLFAFWEKNAQKKKEGKQRKEKEDVKEDSFHLKRIARET